MGPTNFHRPFEHYSLYTVIKKSIILARLEVQVFDSVHIADNIEVFLRFSETNYVSKNVPLCHRPYLRQILTDFKNSFTSTLSEKFVAYM